MTREELETAVSLFLDDKIPGELFVELQDHLRGSAEARKEYKKLVRLHTLLHEEAGRGVETSGGMPVPMDLIVARQRRRALRRSMMLAAAAVLALSVVWLFVQLPDSPVGQVRGSALAEFSITGEGEEDRAGLEGGSLQIGSRVQLSRGYLELELDSGVRGIVQAPADFTLREKDLVQLDSGTAWFEVSEDGKGFRVKTPELLLTDLGTEFGVRSEQEDRDEVHVFKGEVEIMNLGGSLPPLTLEAEQARLAEKDGSWREIELDAEGFNKVLPSKAALPPHLYWSFDEKEASKVGGTHPDRKEIEVSRSKFDDAPEVVPGRVKKALHFAGRHNWIETDWPGIGGNRPRAVAFWLKVPPLPKDWDGELHDISLFFWGRPDAKRNKQWVMRVTNYDYTQGRSIGNVTHLTLAFGAGQNFNGSTQVADGKWHHLAAVYDGKTDSSGLPAVTLYVDGVVEKGQYWSGSVPFRVDTDTQSKEADRLRITTTRSPDRPKDPNELPEVYTIDELYIIDGKVAEDVIWELANP